MARRAILSSTSTSTPDAGAQCGSPARWDLSGGPRATGVPTAKNQEEEKEEEEKKKDVWNEKKKRTGRKEKEEKEEKIIMFIPKPISSASITFVLLLQL